MLIPCEVECDLFTTGEAAMLVKRQQRVQAVDEEQPVAVAELSTECIHQVEGGEVCGAEVMKGMPHGLLCWKHAPKPEGLPCPPTI